MWSLRDLIPDRSIASLKTLVQKTENKRGESVGIMLSKFLSPYNASGTSMFNRCHPAPSFSLLLLVALPRLRGLTPPATFAPLMPVIIECRCPCQPFMISRRGVIG